VGSRRLAFLRKSSDVAIIFGVVTDPAPDAAVCLHDRQCTLPEADSSGVDGVVAIQFLERKTWEGRICRKRV
jgi:hypothetical protein